MPLSINNCGTELHELFYSEQWTVPEVNSGSSLVEVRGTDGTDAALAVEYSYEGRVVLLWPVCHREAQRVGEVLGRVTELHVAVHGYLVKNITALQTHSADYMDFIKQQNNVYRYVKD